MIVLDIEASGPDTGKNGIWQIGAIELENPENKFIEESKIDDDDLVDPGALIVIGKTEEELRDPIKQSQEQLILNFLEWATKCKDRVIIGHNIGWDMIFIQNRSIKYGFHKKYKKIIGYKGMDTYTIGQLKHLKNKGEFSLKEDGRGDMGLHKVLEFCGMKDNRISLNDKDEIEKKGTPHNALEDCKLTGECFSRLIYGKNLFPEYAEFEIPGELIK